MFKENWGYLVITAAECGATIYESLNAVGGAFPNSEVPKLLGLSFAVTLSNFIFQNRYKYPAIAFLTMFPIGAISFLEGSKFATETLTSFDHKVIFGGILFTLVSNILNRPTTSEAIQD